MAFENSSDCGPEAQLDDVLLPGTSLCHGLYQISGFLSSGGFGITYLAKDSLSREVVVKECFVPTFCRRSRTNVVARSETNKANLQRAIGSFRAEAHILAALSHPNIVRVHQVFDDNDTAYMALDHIKGHDLQQIVDEKKASLSPEQIATLARKLILAVGHIHNHGLLHCDISPDNVCVREDGEPVLIDFGSARKIDANGCGQQAGFVLVKDGYSPYELYAAADECGAYSDIYALGATLYHAISGAVPVDCQARISAVVDGRPDPLKPLAGSFTGYPQGFLESVDKALSVQRSARYQSAQDWLAALGRPPQVQPQRNVSVLRRVVVSARPEPQVAEHAQSA